MSNNQLKNPSPSELFKESLKKIENDRVIPLLTGKSAENIFHVAERIVENSGCLVGIDFKIQGVKDRLKYLKRKGERHFGVFSVSTAKEARTAINSGALFILAPHLDKRILRKCKTDKVFHAPGALTPNEVYCCDDLRADTVSIFPCSVMGGVEWLRRLTDMFPDVKLIPTDMMTSDEVRNYLQAGAYAVAPIIDTGEPGKAENIAEGVLKAGR